MVRTGRTGATRTIRGPGATGEDVSWQDTNWLLYGRNGYMTILTFIDNWRRKSQLTQVAQDASIRCQQQAWDLVANRVASMRTAEVRGYVRARCAAIVNASASAAATRENLSADLQQKLAELITTNLIDHVTGQLTLQPAIIRRAA